MKIKLFLFTFITVFVCNECDSADESDYLLHKGLPLCYPDKVTGFYALDEPHRCAKVEWEKVQQFQVYAVVNVI